VRFSSVLFGLLFLVSQSSFAQSTSLKTELIAPSIAFIYGAGPDGQVDKNHPLGTGFLLSVPKLNQEIGLYGFLATARHIVDPQWAHCGTPNPEKIFYRLNRRSFDPKQSTEGVGYIELPLVRGTDRTFIVDLSNEVDAALIQLSPATAFSLNDYNALFLSVNEMASNDELKQLGVGDMIASGGLLPGASGRNRNYPLFRYGYVAALTEEDIEVPCVPNGVTRSMRLWLVGANLSPGASGSPIIYIPPLFGAASRATIGRAALIGIQSASFLLADVAGITPISYVFEMLENAHLPEANLYRGAIPEKSVPSVPKSN